MRTCAAFHLICHCDRGYLDVQLGLLQPEEYDADLHPAPQNKPKVVVHCMGNERGDEGDGFSVAQILNATSPSYQEAIKCAMAFSTVTGDGSGK